MSFLKFITPTRAGAMSVMRFLRKNYYIFFILIAILPGIIGSFQIAAETNNPTYPIISLGLSLTNADSLIYDDVQTLKENPKELIGMDKPSEGIFQKFKYGWNIFKLIWRFMANIFLITIPFAIIYKILRQRNTSENMKNTGKTIWYGFLFLLFINMASVIFKLISGDIAFEFAEGLDPYQKVGIILFLNLPFHGLASLLAYIVQIIIV